MLAHEVVTLVRSWVGTPYHNTAAIKGVGCDCLGLLRGVYAEIYGNLPEAPPYRGFPPRRGSEPERMILAARDFLTEVPLNTRGPGVVLIFRVHPRLVAWHCGIMTSGTDMVHAHSGREAYEVTLGSRWGEKVAAAFEFPGVGG